jgi:hypothetical protein
MIDDFFFSLLYTEELYKSIYINNNFDKIELRNISITILYNKYKINTIFLYIYYIYFISFYMILNEKQL